MPTYLSRPVFDFRVNWATTPRHSFSYDLRERSLGFASVRGEPLQAHTVSGFELRLELASEAEIDAFDTFTAALKGRLHGFWIPSPFTQFNIQPGIASNFLFQIQDANLRDWLAEHPATHIQFSKAGQTTQYGKIATATVTTDSKELVQLESALATAIDDTWDARKLLYVRLAEDVEKGQFYADNRQTRTVRVLELPTEYAALETGQQPVYLYRFYLDGVSPPVFWNFTGLNENITSTLGGAISATVFNSHPIEHGSQKLSMRTMDDGLELTTWHDASSPVARFLPFTLPSHLWLQIFETTYAAPNTISTVFTGRVKSVVPEGRLLRAQCAAFGGVAEKKFPRFYLQPRCNYALFATGTCKLNRALWTINVVITAISGRLVTVTTSATPLAGESASADFNYWALGRLTVGTGAETQRVTITQSSAVTGTTLQLRTKTPLRNPATLINATAQLEPGCDGSPDACAGKFYNFRRWGGHVSAPQNPSVPAADTNTVNGNKK